LQSISYALTRKNIKNINLRVRADGSVLVSAPLCVQQSQIDAFVQRKRPWIEAAILRMRMTKNQTAADLSKATTQRCVERFGPLVQRALCQLGQSGPVSLRIRTCRSRWGSCQPAKRVIMLNRILYFLPMRLIEYVVLHECAHLIAANHGHAFHRVMREHMPDYAMRRRELKEVGLNPAAIP